MVAAKTKRVLLVQFCPIGEDRKGVIGSGDGASVFPVFLVCGTFGVFSKDLSTDSWRGESLSMSIERQSVSGLGQNRDKVGRVETLWDISGHWLGGSWDQQDCEGSEELFLVLFGAFCGIRGSGEVAAGRLSLNPGRRLYGGMMMGRFTL